MAPKKEARTTLRFKMTFPKKVVGMPILHALSCDLGVAPNILRGRVTEKGAWLELEISGTSRNVGKALQFLQDKGVEVKNLD